MNNEIWKKIDGWNYDISNYGNVRNHKTKHILFTEVSKVGYRIVKLWDGEAHRRTTYYIHRLVAKTFIENENNYPCINHIDGDKLNNYVGNLEWCTYSENNYHAYKIGLKSAYQQKISNKERKNIETMLNNNISVKIIASKYGVHVGCIYQLINRKQIKPNRRNRYENK